LSSLVIVNKMNFGYHHWWVGSKVKDSCIKEFYEGKLPPNLKSEGGSLQGSLINLKSRLGFRKK